METEFRFSVYSLSFSCPPELGIRVERPRTRGSMWCFWYRDHYAFESEDRLVFARTAAGKFVLNISMKELADRVDADVFCRIHKQVIVQLSYAREVHPLAGGNYIVKLSDGSELPIGRNYARDFRARFG